MGDQPADISQQIRDMIMTYIERETCLILAVTPANTDIATSDSLMLAKSADPDGKTTTASVTKERSKLWRQGSKKAACGNNGSM